MSSDERRRLEAAYARRSGEALTSPARLASAGDLFMLQQREALMARVLSARFPEGLALARILVLGCGAGWDLLDLLALGASPHRMVGVEILADRAAATHARLPHIPLVRGDGADLPLATGNVDVALQMTVFSSILDRDLRGRLASELYRVIRVGGVILWFDLRYRNPRNPNVVGLPASEIRDLFPRGDVELRSAILAPPLARPIAGHSRTIATILSLIPPLRSHYFGTIVKPHPPPTASNAAS